MYSMVIPTLVGIQSSTAALSIGEGSLSVTIRYLAIIQSSQRDALAASALTC